MGLTSTIAEKRKAALGKVNEADHGVTEAAERLAKAHAARAALEAEFDERMGKLRSEIGTAEKELVFARERFESAQNRLLRLLAPQAGTQVPNGKRSA